MLPVAFCLPAIAVLLARLRRVPAERKPRLSLFYRCICVMLAYAMLVGPVGLQQAAEGATAYHNLSSVDWSEGNRIVEYGHWEDPTEPGVRSDPPGEGVFIPGYDANGSVLAKLTWDTNDDVGTDPADSEDDTLIEEVYYEYNLQNRLVKVRTIDGTGISETEYKYDPDGNRVQKTVDDGTEVIVTDYLIDSYNHTGYAQVFHETTTTNNDPATTTRTTYTIGDDVISQGKSDWELSPPDDWHWAVPTVQYLLYDGHARRGSLLIVPEQR
jgi:YD repeat-containing protein